MDQLATGWWTQMHNSTEGTVDWFIGIKVKENEGNPVGQVWQAGEQEDVARSVTGRDKTELLGVY